MLKGLFKAILILCGFGLLIYIGSMIMILSLLGGFDKDYSITELKENFEAKKTEIYELKRYFNSIVPKNSFVEIEFDDDNTLSRFGIKPLDSTAGDPNGAMFLEWNLKIHSLRMDSIIKPLGWTRESLAILKEKLDKANCIQIESGEPAKIGFQRSAMGMYFFNVFDEPIPENLEASYNDSCTYILANDRLVLEYGGGAIGSQCFYNND